MQKRRAAQQSKPTLITARLLRRWALPQPSADGDKEERGRVLVIGGAPQMPGAVLLAATAALRAGAGKLQIAACESIAPHVGIAAPAQAAVWGVYLHARAGDALSERIGQMGFLAREVLDEIPTIMNQLGKKRRR